MNYKNNKIKILHLSGTSRGGIAAVIKSLLKYFSNRQLFSVYSLVLENKLGQNLRETIKVFFKLKSKFYGYRGKIDILHFHGAWTLHILLLFEKKGDRKIIISPHGALAQESLKKSKLKKTIASYTYMRKSYKKADCIHALSEKEAKDVLSYGLRNTPIVIIPNGIDMEELVLIDEIEKAKFLNLAKGRRVFLSLSRLHEAKGIEMLIEAFSIFVQNNNNNVLYIVGDGPQEYKDLLKKKIKILKREENIFLLGELSGEMKNTIYSVADIFVLPSYNEGFGLTVLEAFRQQVPVITTTATPFNEILTYECGWYIAPERDTLLQALYDAGNKTTERLDIMGKNGYIWVKSNYSLGVVNEKYASLYLWLLNKDIKIDFFIDQNGKL